jgi:hypothetical protein
MSDWARALDYTKFIAFSLTQLSQNTRFWVAYLDSIAVACSNVILAFYSLSASERRCLEPGYVNLDLVRGSK